MADAPGEPQPLGRSRLSPDAEAYLAEMTAHHVRVAHPGEPCRENNRGVCVAGRPDDGREVWLVVYPSGGLAGVSLDRAPASRHAAAVGGALVALPIVEDHRR